MEIFVSDIYNNLTEWAPLELAEAWDNSGFQLGDLSQKVDNIFITLDLTLNSLEEAIKCNSNLIITHHPLIFKPIKTIDFSNPYGAIINKLIKADISVISMHTNLDSASDGVSDALSDIIELKDREPILNNFANNRKIGLGRCGKLKKTLFLSEILGILKNKISVPYFMTVGSPESRINSIAVCGGSGSDLWNKVLEKHVDLFISSEIKHHVACDARDRKINIIDLGHFNSEYLIVSRIEEFLSNKAKENHWNVSISVNKKEKSPFNFL
jgi:dinuclear metal center YbgI/SA1388 family protein